MAILDKLRKAKQKVTRNSGMDNEGFNIEREFGEGGEAGMQRGTVRTGKKSYLKQGVSKIKEASQGAEGVIEDTESGDLDMFGMENGNGDGVGLDDPIDPMGLEQESSQGSMDDDLDIDLSDFD